MPEPAAPTWYEPLNERERQILRLIMQGASNAEIALGLHLSLDTIKWYNKNLFSKLGVSSRTQAAAAARALSMLDQPPLSPAVEQAHPKQNFTDIPTSFIGRHKELAEIKELLLTSRLLVLTGAGGSGKTRLAMKVAAEVAAQFRDGAWRVELAPLTKAELVPNAIADALGVSQRGETDLFAKIKRFLHNRQLLLVLDNFEHLLEAAPLAGELISAAPHIQILATSRERLHVHGEQEYIIQPLALPAQGQSATHEELLRSEAASLFIDRARAMRHDFQLSPEDLPVLRRICVQLDGLPLALELAASRVKMLSLTALEKRLNSRLNLLTDGAQNLPARQRTLRATLDWSYNLLNEPERNLFSSLAVFRAGGTLDAIEHICGKELASNLLSILFSLVDKSLVQARESEDGDMRFGMLETIREYAFAQLEEGGQLSELTRQHAEYYAAMAEKSAGEIRGERQHYWFARLRSEYDNLRVALNYSMNSPEIEAGMRITAALRDYWFYSGMHIEYRYWTDLAIERMPGASPALQAGVMVSASLLGITQEDQRRGEHFLEQAISIYTQLGQMRETAWCKVFLSAHLSRHPAEHDRGISLCHESLAVFQQSGDLVGQAQALNILGEFSRVRLDLETAEQYYEHCLELVAATGERLREGMLWGNLGFIAYHQADYLKAMQRMQAFLQIMKEFENDYWLLTAIASMSGPLAALGQPERAAQLLAAAETQLREMGSGHQATNTGEIHGYHRAIRELLGEEKFLDEWEKGSRLNLQQMVRLVQETTAQNHP